MPLRCLVVAQAGSYSEPESVYPDAAHRPGRGQCCCPSTVGLPLAALGRAVPCDGLKPCLTGTSSARARALLPTGSCRLKPPSRPGSPSGARGISPLRQAALPGLPRCEAEFQPADDINPPPGPPPRCQAALPELLRREAGFQPADTPALTPDILPCG